MSKIRGKSTIRNAVMEKIRSGKVTMRPRAFFILASVILGIGFAGSIMLAVFFLHVALFRFRIHAPLGFLLFGGPGLRPFFTTFPLIPLLLAASGLFGGMYLLRKYDFSYRKNFAGLVVLLSTAILTLGFLLDSTGLGERIGHARYLRGVYQTEFVGQDWVVGEVMAAGGQELTLITPDGEDVQVSRDETTLLPFGADFREGDVVRVVGEWEDGIFIARGINIGGGHMGRGMFENRQGEGRGIRFRKGVRNVR